MLGAPRLANRRAAGPLSLAELQVREQTLKDWIPGFAQAPRPELAGRNQQQPGVHELKARW